MSNPTIVRLVKGNPRRKDTHGWRSWNLLVKGMTYDQYIKVGGRRGDVAWDLMKGNVKLVEDGKRVGMPAAVMHKFTKGSAPVPRGIDDSKVKVLHSSRRWRAEYRTKPAIVHVKDVGNLAWHERLPTVWVSPKGRRYVDALPTEKADLLIIVGSKDFWGSKPPVKRLKRFKDSAVARHEKRERKETKRAVKRHEAKRQAKKTQKHISHKPAKRGKKHGLRATRGRTHR